MRKKYAVGVDIGGSHISSIPMPAVEPLINAVLFFNFRSICLKKNNVCSNEPISDHQIALR
jgi:hypothetical protein